MSDAAVGDYVYATKWSDGDAEDPWAVGHVVDIRTTFDQKRWRVKFTLTDKFYPSIEDYEYWFRHAVKLKNPQHGEWILNNRPQNLTVDEVSKWKS